MSRFLENKKILLVTTQFYGYEQKIITAIRNQGAELTVYFDDPVSYTRLKFLKNWISSGTRTRVNRFYRGYIIKYTRKKQFDYIFFLKGSIMSEPFLQTGKALLFNNKTEQTSLSYGKLPFRIRRFE